MLQKILNEHAEKICKTYKITPEEVKSVLLAKLNQNPKVLELINSSTDSVKLNKNKNLKDLIKQAKKEIYYSLRTYKRDANDLVQTHASTQERHLYLTSFLTQLDPYLQAAETVLDIGGGLFVASLNFTKYSNIKRYIWIDKDRTSYEKLVTYKTQNNIDALTLYNHAIGEFAWGHYSEDPAQLALMLKLVPVVARQEKHLLELLAQVPSTRIVVTGSKEALVKKTDIQKREALVVQAFIGLTHKSIEAKIDIQNEFGYVLS